MVLYIDDIVNYYAKVSIGTPVYLVEFTYSNDRNGR